MINVLKTTLLLSLITITQFSFAQDKVQLPKASPAAYVSQVVGVTTVSVAYHRPSVKERVIWGGIVPNDQVWRAGANDNTVVTTDGNLTINGYNLPQGAYGFHIIPSRTDWVIIFSKNNSNWGSYSYKKEEDAIRVTLKPEDAPMVEQLTYTFENVSKDGASLVLRWERKKVSIPFTVNVEEAMKMQVTKMEGWQPLNVYATYLLEAEKYQDALQWAVKSIAFESNFQNKAVAMRATYKLGKTSESTAAIPELLNIGKESEINMLGYQLMGDNRMQDAQTVLAYNVEKNPDSWNAHDSLAECYQKQKNNKKAKKHYELALEKAIDETQKERIKKTIESL